MKKKKAKKTKVKTRKTTPKKKKAAPKKRPAKRTAKKKAKKKVRRAAPAGPKTIVPPPANGRLLGRVEDFFAKINVIAFTLSAPLSIGSHIQILGHTTNIEQTVDSMQIDHQPVSTAPAQSAVGIKVNARARRGDYVYLVP